MEQATASESDTTGAEAHSNTLAPVIHTAIGKGKAVAAWRLPHTNEAHVAVSLQDSFTPTPPTLENSPFGFLFCPFQESEPAPNLFIKADLYISQATGKLTAAIDAPAPEVADFMQALELGSTTPQRSWHTSNAGVQQQSDLHFQDAVAAAVAAIKEEQMEKVVLSRNSILPLPLHLDLAAVFEQMCQKHSRAFVSVVSVPGVGTWAGASPEILVSINEQQVFHTVALAGTQPATESVADAIWRQKEIEEQAMVERYILLCFKSLRLREYTEIGPRTVVAGNLMHLRTDFKVDLKEVDFPSLGTDMLRLLHPTSAVCGLPKAPALQFILEHEGYDRSYYSGFLGPVNSKAGTHLFVNLRCMQLLKDKAIIYAGAGITAESDPVKEWMETQHKMVAMQRILQQF
ncbi:isochorismate synthase [Pontibacter diazotrophicus]|uniref:Isochorismate synthase n=1 Tax=Pontibacter diazotrophicus TaxID=1400979 RepID=A0A3D8LG35_9BACT|nr:chorismate-binding protein [Pontibacter diazotrophicus]RDV16370.1 isochorismate synthase [Pontibacter diazotrophicus]